jgi:hypothetical protein
MSAGFFPIATGVPGNATPPDWLKVDAQGNHPPPPFDGTPDDPRWVGSFAQSFGDGTDIVQVLFRGLTDAANASLYLSWLVNVDPQLTIGLDGVYVGFSTAVGTVLVHITLVTDTTTNFGVVGPNTFTPLVEVFSDGANPGWTSVSTPSWISDTRVWINYVPDDRSGPNPTPWAIQMKVPVGPLGPGLPTLQAGTNFNMWWGAELGTPSGSPVEYSWPGTQTIINSNPPLPTTWPAATILTPNSSNPNVGISMELFDSVTGLFDLGTKNLDGTLRGDSSTIQFDSHVPPPPLDATAPNHSNIFFAIPQFPPGMDPARKPLVQARFRIANWGSQIGDVTPQSWQDIPGGLGRPFDPSKGACEFTWPTQELLDQGDQATLSLLKNFRTGTTTTDQCMLVQLSSSFPGETFVHDSVRRNMDLVRASKFSRNAEISIVGLTPFSRIPRDVYLYLETVNMPATVIDQSPPLERPNLFSTRGGRQDVPTYRVHVYHDTGNRTTVRGVSRPILEPQSSFGFFATHDGNLIGWAARLHGAIRIAENFYLLRVPNNGVATVNTVIQAIENPNEPVDPEDPIVPIPPPVTESGAVVGAERFFIGYFGHGGVASVANFPNRFVSPIDNYAYKQSEVRYEYYLHSTRLPDEGFAQGQRNPPDDADAGSGPGDVLYLLWNVDDSTGRVSLETSYSFQQGEERKETVTHDGCVKIYAVGQWASGQHRPHVYYVEAPNMDPNVVRQIQQALSQKGQDPGPIDGDYGPRTAAAVSAFQAANGLVADGEVGPKTARALGVQL